MFSTSVIEEFWHLLSIKNSFIPLFTCMTSLWIESKIIPNLVNEVSIIPILCSRSSPIWPAQANHNLIFCASTWPQVQLYKGTSLFDMLNLDGELNILESLLNLVQVNEQLCFITTKKAYIYNQERRQNSICELGWWKTLKLEFDSLPL